jgi:hypothetical protein
MTQELKCPWCGNTWELGGTTIAWLRKRYPEGMAGNNCTCGRRFTAVVGDDGILDTKKEGV